MSVLYSSLFLKLTTSALLRPMSLLGAKRRGNLMFLRRHYEVTALSAIARDDIHSFMDRCLASVATSTRE